MNNDKLYQNFKTRWKEVTELPPQNLGPLTPVYKQTVPYLKIAPWRVLLPVAFVMVAAIALLLEITAVQIASLLQRGF